MGLNNIRNFVIIAHIDHGKSTLADRFLEITGTIEKRKMREQFLDMHPLERERGITIKMQPVRMTYRTHILNLIDTPGHVDFSYEVSRALAAVEGAILLVDATQGIQAQTIANLNLARQENLTIIPVVNKIDLASAEVEKTTEEMAEFLGVAKDSVLQVSGKTGQGVDKLLQAVVEKIFPPERVGASENIPLRALVFDSSYDAYLGVIVHIRIFDGVLQKNDPIFFMATKARCEALEVGIFSPDKTPKQELGAGEIGYVATGLKEPDLVKVGDTITTFKRLNGLNVQGVEQLPGYREPTPMVFSSIFPENQDEYEVLRDSLKKLKLNDAALNFEPEASSAALGRGFRAGFLGMLHMEIVAERLRREYGLKLVFTNPSVAFRVVKRSGEEEIVYATSRMPDAHEFLKIEEPWVCVEVLTPSEFLGSLATLISERGGSIMETRSILGSSLAVKAEIPLREIIIDFYDKLKSMSHGLASMSYEIIGYRDGDLMRLDILVAGEKVMPFSEMVPRPKIEFRARSQVQKLKGLLPRTLFSVALQAEVGGRIIARETLPALRKDVTGYLYGGDRTRKMKLWKKQQRGKKRLKETGKVEIPPDVFLKMMQK